jgi:cell division cycle 20-like protein 1 (cofactor of APC complex)
LTTFQDDFYLNLVSWSSTNVLGVGLNACVYLWSAHTSKVTKLCDLGASSGPSAEDSSGDSATGIEWTNRVSQDMLMYSLDEENATDQRSDFV